MNDNGAIAQLGERYNGIVEVSGSIPLSSTNRTKNPPSGGFFVGRNQQLKRWSGGGSQIFKARSAARLAAGVSQRAMTGAAASMRCSLPPDDRYGHSRSLSPASRRRRCAIEIHRIRQRCKQRNAGAGTIDHGMGNRNSVADQVLPSFSLSRTASRTPVHKEMNDWQVVCTASREAVSCWSPAAGRPAGPAKDPIGSWIGTQYEGREPSEQW